MSLEQEMHHEVSRLEKEIEDIDLQLKKLHDKIFYLLNLHEKKEHDLRTLKGSLSNQYIENETDAMIENIIKGKQKAEI